MKQHFIHTSGMLALAVAAGAFSFCCTVVAAPLPADDHGVLTIGAGAVRQEMPAVRFNHDSHARFVKDNAGTCGDCHTGLAEAAVRDAKAFMFKGQSSDKTSKGVADAWHEACLACHEKQAKAPGAAACRSCHADDGKPSARQAVHFGKGLHGLHVASGYIDKVVPLDPVGDVRNCGACHSTKDAVSGKAVYEQNTEDASTFFGKDVVAPADKARTAHSACVVCHVSTMAKHADRKLPVDCVACHGPKGQLAFPKDKTAPRLYRGQADSLTLGMVKDAGSRSLSGCPEAALKPVHFDHKMHEDVAACSACHGSSITKKSADGKTTLATRGRSAYSAAHDASDAGSCVGCHGRTVGASRDCAGCHKGLTFAAGKTCTACHGGNDGKAPMKQIDPADVPESVVIKSLAEEYEQVVLPHRKIYQSLLHGLDGNALAKTFHRQSVCMACHHNVPGDTVRNPAKCSTCHDSSVTAMRKDQLPNLKAAYHQMCLGCHVEMNVKPTPSECAGCHARAKGQTLQEVR